MQFGKFRFRNIHVKRTNCGSRVHCICHRRHSESFLKMADRHYNGAERTDATQETDDSIRACHVLSPLIALVALVRLQRVHSAQGKTRAQTIAFTFSDRC